ncbi:MAG: replication-relaxation family protein [Pseudomonadota bacterium]
MNTATLDSLGRRLRTTPQTTGKRVRLTDRDCQWLRALLAHGPLPSSYLLAFSAKLGQSEKRARERLTDLFNEADTAHGGPYLSRPLQQFRTLDSRYNQLVYDLAPPGRRALETGDLPFEAPAPGGPWVHRLMVSCITASIELAVSIRDDLTFIPGWRILERAGATLRTTVETKEPGVDHAVRRALIPDALFGLQYRTPAGDRFRFFVVEADRGTEPLKSRCAARKSWRRSLAQYDEYIGRRRYRDHLQLTAPLLVLNVASDADRERAMHQSTQMFHQHGCTYHLFQSFEAFGAVWRPPQPNPALLEAPWLRTGHPDMHIGDA